MRKVSIRFAESAVVDLEVLRNWYTEQGVPDVGAQLVAEVFERIEALREYPEIGRVVPEFDQPFLRELIHPPFRIVYRHDTKHGRIVQVWRSERLLALPEENSTQDMSGHES